MRFYFLNIALPIIIILIDIIAYYGERHIINGFKSKALRILIKSLYWLVSAITVGGILYLFMNQPDYTATSYYQKISLFLAFCLLFYLPKLIFIVFIIIHNLVALFRWGMHKMSNTEPSDKSRRKFILNTGLVVAALPFLSILHGVTRGKYLFQVHEVPIRFAGLPKAFNGYKIIQISDFHINAFLNNEDQLERAIGLINEQQPDLVVFTGDMVNNNSNEMKPFVEQLKGIKAKDGNLSILGNHDYGDYSSWPSDEEKDHDHQQLISYQEQAGFKVLRNENFAIDRDGESINILGVENYGKPPFPQYGDLAKTMQGVNSDGFKILLSHDPSHWDIEVLEKTNIALTLSGHTHGMQMGIDIPGFKWSPVQYRYPRWAGLYAEGNQFLYVNRGLGFIGYAGRAGIYPEITSFELLSS